MPITADSKRRPAPSDAYALDNIAKRVEIEAVILRSSLDNGFVKRRRSSGGGGPAAGWMDGSSGGDGHGGPRTPKGKSSEHFEIGRAGTAGAGGVPVGGSDGAAAGRAAGGSVRAIRFIQCPVQSIAASRGGSVSHDPV